jgi:hypothetical protein
MLCLASHTPNMDSHGMIQFLYLQFFSEPSCMCAERCCLLAWLGFVCAPYGFTYSPAMFFYIRLFQAELHVRGARLHTCMAWLRVRPVWLQVQPLDLYFLSRAACAPSEVTCLLGLASRTPRTATHTIPLSVLSEPNSTCAERGHVYPWPGLMYVCMPTQTVHFSFLFWPSFTRAKQGCMHARLGLYTYSSPIWTFRPVCCSALSEAVGRLSLTAFPPDMTTHPIHHLHFPIRAAGTATEPAARGSV